MHYRVLDQEEGRRTLGVALEIGEPAVESILRLATELGLGPCLVSAIGGFQRVKLAYFAGCTDPRSHEPHHGSFVENELNEQFEVLSLTGNLSREEGSGAQHLHAHVVLGRADSSTMGGHLVEATVRPTLEIMILETHGRLLRGMDEKTRLVVLKP